MNAIARFIALVGILVLFAGINQAGAQVQAPMSLSVSLAIGARGPALAMTLTNVGDRTVQLMGDNLPWSRNLMGGAMVQLYVARPAFQPLTKAYPMGHSTAFIPIAPGQSLNGTVELHGLFPHLQEALENEEELMYFWAWRAIPFNNEEDPAKMVTLTSNLIAGVGLIPGAKLPLGR